MKMGIKMFYVFDLICCRRSNMAQSALIPNWTKSQESFDLAYSPLNSAKLSCSSEVTFVHIYYNIYSITQAALIIQPQDEILAW